MLAAMERSYVFKLDATDDGQIAVIECCDEAFAAYITPEQLRSLAREMIEYADTHDPSLTRSPSPAPAAVPRLDR